MTGSRGRQQRALDSAVHPREQADTPQVTRGPRDGLCCVPQRTRARLPRSARAVDEIWQFVGAKTKNATTEQNAQGWGDVWRWTAIDADTELVPSWFVRS